VVSGSREENAIKKKESIFKRSMPLAKAGVVSGSREENAVNQELRA
jgi:hypothetical protein